MMRAGKHLVVEHPQLTLGELTELGNSGERLERSGHIGNQNLRELVVLTHLPVHSIMVDTIAGNDVYSKPCYVVVDGKEHRMASGKSDSKIVSSAPLLPDRHEKLVSQHPELKELGTPATMAELHAASVAAINLAAHMPQTATEMLASLGDTGRALMEELDARGRLRRIVTAGGRISILPTGDDARAILGGILGQPDASPPNEGAMLPLEGMMAMDMLSALKRGSDHVTHLAGRDMRRYTRDEALMTEVGDIMAGTQMRLGECAVTAHYVVVDITGFKDMVTPEHANIGSQYDLIVSSPVTADRRIQLVPHALDMPTYSPMEA